uniref:Teleost multiple tissue opsin 3a n=1 Tax=Callorhinchus milii TaxID=7868 RepID=A0A4W3I3D3_CALMI
MMAHSANISTTLNASDHAPNLAGLSQSGHTTVAVFLGIILVLGCVNNLLVLLLFVCFKEIRTPLNMILLNISLSDLSVCVFGTPFSFAASIYRRWLIGHKGCKWYGFANSLFGIVSLISLSLLSYERYATVLKSTKADSTNYKKAWVYIAFSWFYSLVWTLPPLFGWSKYGPEGYGTTCSVIWHLRSPNNASYIICLFLFCLILPVLLMAYCYGRIIQAIRGVGKINQMTAQTREHRILLMVISMVTFYLLCWLPYGTVALIGTFGNADLITPTCSVIPSILAKSSTVINPVIYVIMNKQIYKECKHRNQVTQPKQSLLMFILHMSFHLLPIPSHTLLFPSHSKSNKSIEIYCKC